MNQTFFRSSCLAAVCGISLAVSARADEFVKYRAKPIGSTVVLDGAANIHEWKMTGSIIGGSFEVPAGVTLDSKQAAIGGLTGDKLNAKAEVGIPVTSIKNGKYEGMDEVMQQAMDAPNFPRIVYHLETMTLKQPHAAGSPFQFDTTGELSFHGSTNKVSMPVTIESQDGGMLKISATSVSVNMTDYKVRPPVKLGIFKTDPEVKITFEWLVGLPKQK